MSNETVGKELGVVKWFNSAKGYGFIDPMAKKAKIYLSTSLLFSGTVTSLSSEGDRVSFDTTRGPKGLQAENVRVTEEAAPKSYPPEVRRR